MNAELYLLKVASESEAEFVPPESRQSLEVKHAAGDDCKTKVIKQDTSEVVLVSPTRLELPGVKPEAEKDCKVKVIKYFKEV